MRSNPNNADDWFGVEDARKRKQIQDRLAQRARRNRLAQLKIEKTILSTPGTQEGKDVQHAVRGQGASGNDRIVPFQMLEESAPTASPNCYFDSASTALSAMIHPERRHLTPPPVLSVYSALYNNGRLFGLLCSNSAPCKSPPASPAVPSTLWPTMLQLITIHFPWIDRFPFPRMREHMINLSGFIDEEEFLADLFTLPSFAVEPGTWSWDAAAWKFADGSEEFQGRWGYLFS